MFRPYWIVSAVALPLLLIACEEPPPPKAAAAGPEREVVLREPQHRPAFDRAREGVRTMKSFFGKEMTPQLASDLQFRCAELKGATSALEREDDPIVQRVRADVELLCGLEVPVASARMEIALIDKKKKEEPGAQVKRECRGLHLALGDIGPQYASNPQVVEIGAKYAALCPPE